MDTLEQLIEKYEDIEKNGALYIKYRKQYEFLLEKSILEHDLDSLQKHILEFMALNKKYDKNLITTELNRMDHICNAMLKEKKYSFPLFWNTETSLQGLMYKYDNAVFMLRRLLFDLPDIYKTEAIDYLIRLSPFIISEIYRDATSIVGMKDYIYITLSTEHLRLNNALYALIYLKKTNSKNNEINSLISQLESITDTIGECYE